MRVYVAGKWQEKDLVRSVMQYLTFHGHEISYDWTIHNDDDDKTECSNLDLNGVRTSDAVVVVALSNVPYRGAFVELGAALALGKPVMVLGSGMDGCILLALCKTTHCLEDIKMFLSSLEKEKLNL